MKKNIVFILLLSLIDFLYANEVVDTSSVYKEDSVFIKKEYRPSLFGVIKTDFEWNTETGDKRFLVRNARLGIKGDISPLFDYRMEVDLSDEGVFRVLCAYGVFKPIQLEKHKLSIWAGYLKPFFSTEYLRSPMTIVFVNRSLLVSEMTAGLVDVGIVADYYFNNNVLPFDVSFAVMNGMGFKNRWFYQLPNYNARFRLFPHTSLMVVGEYYGGNNMYNDTINMFGVECAYNYKNFYAGIEYLHRQRQYCDTNVFERKEGIMTQFYYKIPIKNINLLHYITPTLRWEMIGNQIFSEKLQIGGLTTGLNFGIDKDFLKAEFRINYEKYFKTITTTKQDIFSVEVIIGI